MRKNTQLILVSQLKKKQNKKNICTFSICEINNLILFLLIEIFFNLMIGLICLILPLNFFD